MNPAQCPSEREDRECQPKVCLLDFEHGGSAARARVAAAFCFRNPEYTATRTGLGLRISDTQIGACTKVYFIHVGRAKHFEIDLHIHGIRPHSNISVLSISHMSRQSLRAGGQFWERPSRGGWLAFRAIARLLEVVSTDNPLR